MDKKCSKCQKVKDIKEFRYMSAQKRYCAYCRKCEVLYTQELRAKSHRENLKRNVRKNWTELCQNMTQCELDQEIFNLKEIYNKAQQEKADNE